MKMKLSVKSFALTVGIMKGLGICAITWWIICWDGATGDPTFLGMIYRGYSISPEGSVIGLLWGLGDGLIFGALFALIYNCISCCCCKKDDVCCKEESPHTHGGSTTSGTSASRNSCCQ